MSWNTAARWAYDNHAWIAGTTYVASGEATGYPATNLASSKRGLVWRSTTTTGSQDVLITFPTSQTVQVVALVNWRAHAGGTVKAEYWNGAAYVAFGGGTGLFTLPASNRTRLIALWSAAGVATTRVRITFTNTAAVSAAVELGVVFAAAYLEPSVSVANALSYDVADPSVVETSEGGQRQFWIRQAYLELTQAYLQIPAADKDALLAMYDAVGRHGPVVVALDADDPQKVAYGTLAGRISAQHQALDVWNVAVPFVEAC